jgi:hypothetical protein
VTAGASSVAQRTERSRATTREGRFPGQVRRSAWRGLADDVLGPLPRERPAPLAGLAQPATPPTDQAGRVSQSAGGALTGTDAVAAVCCCFGCCCRQPRPGDARSAHAAAGGHRAISYRSFPSYLCPPSHAWLLKARLSPGRLVPNGIQVLEAGGVGVTLFPPTRDHNGLVTGYADGSATNWTPSFAWSGRMTSPWLREVAW